MDSYLLGDIYAISSGSSINRLRMGMILMGGLLAGAVITETIFSWDGIGRLLVESIEKRDYPVTQACVLVVALSYVMVNLATDMLYILADPRVRKTS